MRPLNEFAGLLLAVPMVAAGVGAIGGVVSGGLLGLGGVWPKLPVSLQPSGGWGGWVGGCWWVGGWLWGVLAEAAVLVSAVGGGGGGLGGDLGLFFGDFCG